MTAHRNPIIEPCSARDMFAKLAEVGASDWIDPFITIRKDTLSDLRDERDRLAARVAELEAQLVAQSAQGWRDFTERPPIGEPIQIITVIDAVREEPDGLYRIGHTSEWQTWRPAPQEPTP